MEDNNTSCFNYRVVDGTTSLSKHALGCAIDINPFITPMWSITKMEAVKPISLPRAVKDMRTAPKIFRIRSMKMTYVINFLQNMALSGAETGTPPKIISTFRLSFEVIVNEISNVVNYKIKFPDQEW